jgi:hypothetical protein
MSPRPQGTSPPQTTLAPRIAPVTQQPTSSAPAKHIPERSIFAELRRSSEIFKSILLNLSMREMDSAATADHSAGRNGASSPADNQVDLARLLAAHEQRRLNQQEEESSSNDDDTSSCPSSCSESSLSTSDDDDDDEGPLGMGSPRQDDPNGQLLRINPNLSPDKVAGMTDVYTRHYLFTLPAIFLAVVRGNATLVYLLLKYGAAVNFQVCFTNFSEYRQVVSSGIMRSDRIGSWREPISFSIHMFHPLSSLLIMIIFCDRSTLKFIRQQCIRQKRQTFEPLNTIHLVTGGREEQFCHERFIFSVSLISSVTFT